MALKIEMLRSFCTVVQTGNLAEAAVRLGRTQSAVSMTLKQLEEHLGQRLFETERKNRLSLIGAQIFELAQLQLRQFDDTMQAIEASASSPRGLIRIASVPSVVGLVFPQTIQTMTRRYPGLSVELRDSDSPQVIDALLQGQADIGIASGLQALNGIQQTRLFRDRFGLICAADHPLARQAQDPTIAELVASGFVRNNLCSLIAAPGFQAAIADAHVSVPNTLSLVAMVRTGNWVTILPETVAQIMPDDLVFRPVAGLSDQRDVVLLVRDRSPYRKIAEEFGRLIVDFDWAGV